MARTTYRHSTVYADQLLKLDMDKRKRQSKQGCLFSLMGYKPRRVHNVHETRELQNGCANITSCSLLSIDEKKFTVNIGKT